jgi:proline iminopeptidase
MTTLETKLGIQAQLEDIERIRQILGEDKLILVGHSFGGLLAALYTAEYPEKVRALILIAPADLLKMPGEHGDLFWTVRKDLPKTMQPEFDAWQKQYFDFGGIFNRSESELQALNQQFSKFYGEAVKAKGLTMPDLPSAPGLIGGWATHAQYFSLGKKHDYRAAMDVVKIPVLVIHGANDLQSEAASKDFAAVFPNAHFLSLAETGHFPFVQKPEAFATAVRRFLSEDMKRN